MAADEDPQHDGNLQHERSGKAGRRHRHVVGLFKIQRQPGEEDPEPQAGEHRFGEQHVVRGHARKVLDRLEQGGALHRGLRDRRGARHDRFCQQREHDAADAERPEARTPAVVLRHVAGEASAEHHPGVHADRDQTQRPRPRTRSVILRNQRDRGGQKEALRHPEREAQREQHRKAGRQSHQRRHHTPRHQAADHEPRPRKPVRQAARNRRADRVAPEEHRSEQPQRDIGDAEVAANRRQHGRHRCPVRVIHRGRGGKKERHLPSGLPVPRVACHGGRCYVTRPAVASPVARNRIGN